MKISLNSFLKTIRFYIDNGFCSKRIKTDARLIKVDLPLFNYFNRLQITNNGFILFKTAHYDGFMYKEIQIISGKITNILGLDNFGKGVYKDDEYKDFSSTSLFRSGQYLSMKLHYLLGAPPTDKIKFCLPFCLFFLAKKSPTAVRGYPVCGLAMPVVFNYSE